MSSPFVVAVSGCSVPVSAWSSRADPCFVVRVDRRRPITGISVSDSARMICTATGTNCSAESKTM